jgi:hypothetical protein
MPREEFEGRYTTIYFSTTEEKQHWDTFAKERGTNIGKLALEALRALQAKTESSPRPDLLKEIEGLKADLAKAQRELKLQGNVLEKYEAELYRARYASFQEPVPTGNGIRYHDLELLSFLRSSKIAQDSGKILAHLQIDPGDREAVRLVRSQLENLERYGLIRQDSHGWRWKK